MAITVGLTLDANNSLITAGVRVQGLVSVTNGGAQPVVVTGVTISATNPSASVVTGGLSMQQPVLPITSGAGAGLPTNLVPTLPNVVNNGATAYFPFHVTSMAPALLGSANLGILLNPVVTLSDGSMTSAYGSTVAPTQNAASTSTTGGTGLTATTQYFYKVTALGAQGESAPSGEQNVTTGAGATNSNTVNWTAFPGAVLGYRIYRGTATNAENVFYTAAAGATSFLDTGAASSSGSPPSASTFANLSVRSFA